VHGEVTHGPCIGRISRLKRFRRKGLKIFEEACISPGHVT